MQGPKWLLFYSRLDLMWSLCMVGTDYVLCGRCVRLSTDPRFRGVTEEIKDSIVNDYSENLKNALKLKNLLAQVEKIGIIG